MVAKAIAIIPARGGSTRVPKKNILDFYGKPMIAYTIEACLKSGKFDRVLVSTDSEEIAEVSKKYGAEVPFLRTECADSMTPVSEAVLFALHQAQEFWNEKYDIVAQLMANCPIRNEADVKNAFDNFVEKGYQSQISCFKFGFMNPWWALKIDKDFKGERIIDIPMNVRSQDLEELYCPTGAVWICKKEHLEKYKSFYGEHNYFEINWKSAVDIDNWEDVEMAKAVYLVTKEEQLV